MTDTATTPTVRDEATGLEIAFERFRAAHPEVVAAMELMNVSISEYLDALAAQQESSTVSNNNSWG